jgi:hypothetical protein
VVQLEQVTCSESTTATVLHAATSELCSKKGSQQIFNAHEALEPFPAIIVEGN